MSKEMIISVNGREKKIAIVEDDVVTEFYVERGDENQGIVGNIYKGRVMKVLPGMQSAFVDIGLERDSFLYVSDFFDEEEEEEEVEEKKETQRQVQKQPRRASRRLAHRGSGGAGAGRREGFRIADGRAAPHRGDFGGAGDSSRLPRKRAGSGIGRSGGRGRGSLSPRQRRQRRLRYADKEAKAEKGSRPTASRSRVAIERPRPPPKRVRKQEEDYSGRRPRRRPRRRRGAEAAEAAERRKSATKGDEELPPYIIVHHEPLERIMDDDTAVAEGEMLKDAMLQERITERIHEEERRASLLEVEPTPEVLVGSLRRSIASELGFERVSDDSELRPDAESDVEPDVQAGSRAESELDERTSSSRAEIGRT